MSEALDRALKELDQLWKDGDHFDTKVLQFVALVSAATALFCTIGTKVELLAAIQRNVPSWVLQVGGCCAALAIVLLAGFFFMALRATLVGVTFSGAIDPRLLVNTPDLLENDAEFRSRALVATSKAFEKTMNALQLKRKRLKIAFAFLLASGVFVAIPSVLTVVSLTFSTRAEPPRVANMPNENTQPTSTPSTTGNTPAGSPQTTPTSKPAVGPYDVSRNNPPGSNPRPTPARPRTNR